MEPWNEHNYFLQVPGFNPHNFLDPEDFINVDVGDENNDEEAVDIEDEIAEEDNEENPDIVVQQAVSYTRLPGVRLNSQVYMDNLRYTYYKHKTQKNKEYLVCANQRNKTALNCPARAIVSTDVTNNAISISGRHNHLPPNVDIPKVHLRRAIGLAGTRTGNMSDSIRHIYNNEIVGNPEGAHNYTFLQAQHSVRAMRRNRRPANPSNIDEFVKMLGEPRHSLYSSTLQRPPSRFFQEQLFVEGETVGVVFANLDAIERYRDAFFSCSVAGVDGTFKTVPSSPPELRNGCLLTFQVVYRHVAFPLVYALTSRMTQATYESFFRIVRRILPLNYGQLVIITDYERGLINGITNVFPESQHRGCWFHYCQAIIRYCRRTLNSVFHLFQSDPIAARVLRMVLALPHLPAEIQPNFPFTIVQGFQSIVQYVSQHQDVHEQLRVFLYSYIQGFWLESIGASHFSVFGSDIRTNNYLESFHRTLLDKIGRHPNIWNFIRKLN